MDAQPVSLTMHGSDPIGIIKDSDDVVVVTNVDGAERNLGAGDVIFADDCLMSLGSGVIEFHGGNELVFASNMPVKLDDEVYSVDRHQDSLASISTTEELTIALDILAGVNNASLSVDDVLSEDDDLLADGAQDPSQYVSSGTLGATESLSDSSLDSLLYQNHNNDLTE